MLDVFAAIKLCVRFFLQVNTLGSQVFSLFPTLGKGALGRERSLEGSDAKNSLTLDTFFHFVSEILMCCLH